MKLWRVLYMSLILCVGVVAHASQINRNSGLGLGRSGPNTARGTVTPSGGTFGELLKGPANLSGGKSDFERLSDMPFKLPDIPPDKAKVKGVLTPANIGKALRGGVGGYLAGEAFKRLAEEACVRLMGGSMQLTESGAWEECVPGAGTPQSTGFEYSPTNMPAPRPWFRTMDAGCQAAMAQQMENTPSWVWGPVRVEGNGCVADRQSPTVVTNIVIANLEQRADSCAAGKYVWSDGTCHDEPQVQDVTWRPITTDQAQQKFEDAIKLPGNASKVWDAMRDYADKGGNFDIDQPLSVTGPAQSPASTTTSQTTQQTANGPQTLTTTNTTVINYNYAGDTITYNQTTTSVTRNEAGDVVSSTTTNGTPEAVDEPPTDTPLPPVPDLYVRKYPDGIVGIWNEKSEEIKQAPLFTLAADLMPDVGSGGTCPSWPLNLDFASWAQFGTHDVAPPCETWGWARLFVIIGALLLARALIFGG